MMGKVFSVNRSRIKGVSKKPIGEGHLKEGWGLLGDAHGGRWHRQVSFLSWERIRNQTFCLQVESPESGRFSPGDFAENITTQGLNLAQLKVGDEMDIGKEIRVRITQIGKKCHIQCAIYQKVGKCIMPEEGIFAEVLKGGKVKAGDTIRMK